MFKLMSGLIGLLLAIAGPGVCAFGGYWWAVDRPAWHVGFCPVCVGWGPGSKLRDAQLQHAFATEHASVITLEHAIAAQDAATRALSAAGAVALAKSETAAQGLRSALAAANERNRTLAAPITGHDPCARVQSFDERFLGTLR